MDDVFNSLDEVVESYLAQIEKVFEILKFDRDYLVPIVEELRELSEFLKDKGQTNPAYRPDKQIRKLEVLVESGPKQHKYISVYNQCLVLLVSHFASAISEIYNLSVTAYLNNDGSLEGKFSKEEIKISLSELQRHSFDLSKEIGSIIARKSDISFQDMGSINRSFKDSMGLIIERDQNSFVIIEAQALRHAIVHNGEKIDDKVIIQTQSCSDRVYKKPMGLGDVIQMEPDILKKISISMEEYIGGLVNLIKKRLSEIRMT